MTIYHLLRPSNWVKNLLLLAPVMMSGNLRHGNLVMKALLATLFFCWLASAGYIFNDWQDRDRDRLHPRKQLRPLAADLITPAQAMMAGAWLALAGLVGLWVLGPGPVTIGGAYLVLALGYSVFFKHQPGVDALVVALLYLLRVQAGAQAIGLHASPWLLALTFSLALPVSLYKRQAEHGPEGLYGVLDKFKGLYLAMFAGAFALYGVYSLSGEMVALSSEAGLAITVPFAAWGLLMLYQGILGGQLKNPVGYLFTSPPLQVAAVGWFLTCFLALYGPL